jgi:hypothetical protein
MPLDAGALRICDIDLRVRPASRDACDAWRSLAAGRALCPVGARGLIQSRACGYCAASTRRARFVREFWRAMIAAHYSL